MFDLRTMRHTNWLDSGIAWAKQLHRIPKNKPIWVFMQMLSFVDLARLWHHALLVLILYIQSVCFDTPPSMHREVHQKDDDDDGYEDDGGGSSTTLGHPRAYTPSI
jgi:hypothetical protein